MRDTTNHRAQGQHLTRSVASSISESRASLYDEVTGRIITELEAGRFPWVSLGVRGARTREGAEAALPPACRATRSPPGSIQGSMC